MDFSNKKPNSHEISNISVFHTCAEAIRNNLKVYNATMGDSGAEDILLGYDLTVARIQIKSASIGTCRKIRIDGSVYKQTRRMIRLFHTVNGQAAPYTKQDVDFIIAFIPITEHYYVMPVDFTLQRGTTINLEYDTGVSCKQVIPYLNNWNLIKQHCIRISRHV